MSGTHSNSIGERVIAEERHAFYVSLGRLIIGGGLTGYSFTGMYLAKNGADYALPVLALLLAIYILIGGSFIRYRPLRAYDYLMPRLDPSAPRGAASGSDTVQKMAQASRSGQRYAALERRSKVVLLLRMLILVGIAAFVVVQYWLEKRAHFEEYGYEGAVSIRYDEDGTQVVTPIE